jgi:hypothetical protein
MIGCLKDVNDNQYFTIFYNSKEIVVNTLDSHRNVEEMDSSMSNYMHPIFLVREWARR